MESSGVCTKSSEQRLRRQCPKYAQADAVWRNSAKLAQAAGPVKSKPGNVVQLRAGRRNRLWFCVSLRNCRFFGPLGRPKTKPLPSQPAPAFVPPGVRLKPLTLSGPCLRFVWGRDRGGLPPFFMARQNLDPAYSSRRACIGSRRDAERAGE
jgi:hypothetical protein